MKSHKTLLMIIEDLIQERTISWNCANDNLQHFLKRVNDTRQNIQDLGQEIKLISTFYEQFKKGQNQVDKQINKIKKDLDKGEKDTKKLLKMDKVQDKKLAKFTKAGKK